MAWERTLGRQGNSNQMPLPIFQIRDEDTLEQNLSGGGGGGNDDGDT